jgi:hypothetical protein
VIPQVTADATGSHLRELALARRRGVGRQVASTAGYNIASTAAAGLGSIIVARALEPEMRGECAAVTAWFGVALMVGGIGQPTALCFSAIWLAAGLRGLSVRCCLGLQGTARCQAIRCRRVRRAGSARGRVLDRAAARC